MDTKGVIYILTNPSFPEYVKIGYADDINARVAQLNRSECTPFAFRIFATLNVPNRLADKNIHALIDKFKPELRAKDNVNGKIRVREFFAISPEEAFELLGIIGGIYGETPNRLCQTKAAKKEESEAIAMNINSERRSPFSFYKCGIKNGDYIFYIYDKSIKCKVVSDRCIEYNGKQTSVSALAKKLLKDLDLDCHMKISKMSKGMQEKLQLILVMSRKADLYILDEPLGGVDPATRDYILDTILSNFHEDASILISTHLIADIERILDDVIFIDHGEIVLVSAADELRNKEGASIDEVFRRMFKC